MGCRLIPGGEGGQEIFLYSAVSRPDLGLTRLPLQWVPGDPSLGNVANRSPPLSGEVKNGEAILTLSHVFKAQCLIN
jgi:hypothetical protein